MRLIKLIQLWIFQFVIVVSFPLLSNAEILFVYYEDYAPFSWLDNGKMRGLYIDVINEVFTENMGLKVTHRGYPWKRAQKMVKDGNADGFCTVMSVECLNYCNVVQESIVSAKLKLYTAKNNPNLETLKSIKSLKNFKNYTFTEYRGNDWVLENLKDFKIHWLDTNDQIWKFLNLGRADLALKNDWTSRYNLKKYGYGDKIVELPHIIFEENLDFHIFLSKSSEYFNLIPQVNKILKKIKQNGALERIHNKYR